MKLDADVRERLAALGEGLPVDEPPVTRMARRGRRRSRWRKAGVAASAVALLGSAGVIGSLVTRGDPAGFGPGSGPQFAALDRDVDLSISRPEEVPDLAVAPAGEPAVPPIAGVGPKIIKTAKLILEVREGAFQDAFTEAQDVAARHGGFVTGSGTTGEDARSGDLTIRVPVNRFEAALADLKELGALRSEDVQGEDVTADFVDLESRLRNWEVQEGVLLRLMRGANSIGESLQVQRRLEDVQGQIERIRGQLRVLADQTDYGTIRLAMHEKGVAQEPPSGKLGSAWSRALSGALDVLSAVVIGLGYLVPIAVLLLLLWRGIRMVRSRSAA